MTENKDREGFRYIIRIHLPKYVQGYVYKELTKDFNIPKLYDTEIVYNNISYTILLRAYYSDSRAFVYTCCVPSNINILVMENFELGSPQL